MQQVPCADSRTGDSEWHVRRRQAQRHGCVRLEKRRYRIPLITKPVCSTDMSLITLCVRTISLIVTRQHPLLALRP